MVHLLVYADLFDIEGLISSPAGKGRKSHIEAVLNAYKADYPKLQAYGSFYVAAVVKPSCMVFSSRVQRVVTWP